MASKGLKITIDAPGISDNPKAVFVPPVREGLQFWNFFGGSSVNTGRNLATGQPAGTVVGAPVVDDYHARMTGMVNYVQTPAIPSTGGATLIAVFKPVLEADGASIISNGASVSASIGGTTLGTSLYSVDTGGADGNIKIRGHAGLVSAGVSSTTDALIDSAAIALAGVDQMFVAFRSDPATDIRTLDNLTADARTVTPANDLPIDIGEAFRVGSQYNTNVDGAIDIYMAAIYNRPLSDVELAELQVFIRGYYARRGITI